MTLKFCLNSHFWVEVLYELQTKSNRVSCFLHSYKMCQLNSIQQHCKLHLFWKTKSNSRWRFWILIGWQSFPIDTLKPKNMKLWSSSTNVNLICNSEFISRFFHPRMGIHTDLVSPIRTFLKRLFLWYINATMTCMSL